LHCGFLRKICTAYLVNTYKDGKEHGSFVSYFSNGQLESKGIFIGRIQDGLHENYYENGRLATKVFYKDGEQHGPHEIYYEDGKLKSKSTFKSGPLDGPFNCYGEEDLNFISGIMKDGFLDGWEPALYLMEKGSWMCGCASDDFSCYVQCEKWTLNLDTHKDTILSYCFPIKNAYNILGSKNDPASQKQALCESMNKSLLDQTNYCKYYSQ